MKIFIGPQLSSLRAERGLTQSELAGATGIGQAVISNLELNKQEPTVANLAKLADFFGVSMDTLRGPDRTKTREQIQREFMAAAQKAASGDVQAAAEAKRLLEALTAVDQRRTAEAASERRLPSSRKRK